jgi:hypothetical protein
MPDMKNELNITEQEIAFLLDRADGMEVYADITAEKTCQEGLDKPSARI